MLTIYSRLVVNHVAIIILIFLMCLYINDYKLLAFRTLTLACWVEAPRIWVALQLLKLVLYRVLYRLVFFDFLEYFLVVLRKRVVMNTYKIVNKKCLKTVKLAVFKHFLAEKEGFEPSLRLTALLP